MGRLLYVTKAIFYPDCSGGAELSTLYLLAALQRRGWRVEVLCALSAREPALWQASLKELGRLGEASGLVTDDRLGYPCRRFVSEGNSEGEWLRRLDACLLDLDPDVVVGAPDPFCPLLVHAAEGGRACFHVAHNLAALQHAAEIPARLDVIANAPFTAAALSRGMQRDVAVAHEMVDPDRYRAHARRHRFITFVNPIPEKGLEVALEVARELADQRFLFVKGNWATMSKRAIEQCLAPALSLPNVEIWEHQSDMRAVYAVTDILFAPSQFTETFGRVILEAHLNGIPVVASDVGGIPYVLGLGGLLVPRDAGPGAYAEAVRSLCNDQSLYRKLSAAARQNSRRPEFDPERQVDAFLGILQRRAPHAGETT